MSEIYEYARNDETIAPTYVKRIYKRDVTEMDAIIDIYRVSMFGSKSSFKMTAKSGIDLYLTYALEILPETNLTLPR